MSKRDIAEQNTILRGVVGSTAHGTGMDGHEDRDEMGVFVEPPVNVLGLSSIDHYIQRDRPEGVRSEPGDLDLTMYSLRKFVRLAASGNPSVLILLWLPEHEVKKELGIQLVGMRRWFISRRAGEAFLGYLVSQKRALRGERTKKVARPELVERFGYDTKFAMHALRLGLEGIELLTENRLTLPVPEPRRTLLRSVRYGELSFERALEAIEDTESQLREVVAAETREVNMDVVNESLVSMHMEHWEYRYDTGEY